MAGVSRKGQRGRKDTGRKKKETKEYYHESLKFALGVLGWTPYEYYCSSPYEFHCACEGYFIKVEHQAQLHRFGSYRIHQSLVQKPLKLEAFWPLGKDKPRDKITWGDTPEERKANWEKIMKSNKIKK